MNSLAMKTRLVIATDVRFWHAKTGAQRRIHSMVKYLQTQNFEIITLLAAPLDDSANGRSASEERRKISAENLDVRSLIDDWKPVGLMANIVWQVKCIANWLSTITRGTDNNQTAAPAKTVMYLADFESSLYYERFHQMLNRIQPQTVLVQYVTLSYLVPERRTTHAPNYIVDTHDHLSRRNELFRKHGYQHWIRITADEEVAALQKFDSVIAIQHQEQQEFQQMIPGDSDVLVAEHPCEPAAPSTVDETLNAEFTLGYFGSDNPSNVQAMEWFLDNVWPLILAKRPETRLLIAGTVCNGLQDFVAANQQQNDRPDSIELRPTIDDIPALYRSFQIAINPVQFGTGLKIKNQEALAYGKPIVTTAQAADAMWPANGFSPIISADEPGEQADEIVSLATDAERLRESAESALQYAAEKLTAEYIYDSELTALLRNPRYKSSVKK